MSRTMSGGSLIAALAIGVAMGSASAQTAERAPDSETGKTAYAAAQPQPELKKMSAADRLLAAEEIKLLPLRYGRCITQRDWNCLRDDVFAENFYYMDGPARVHGWSGFMEVMKRAGCSGRVYCRVNMHGHEVEIMSPTLARGIVAADFSYYHPAGQTIPAVGTEIVPEGQEAHSPSYYYQTYTKVNGKWKLRTSDHISFDLRRDWSERTVIYDRAYVSPDGTQPYKR